MVISILIYANPHGLAITIMQALGDEISTVSIQYLSVISSRDTNLCQ